MANAKQCDICGDFFGYVDNSEEANIISFGATFYHSEYRCISRYDCCPICMQSINNHIASLKPGVKQLELPNESEN